MRLFMTIVQKLNETASPTILNEMAMTRADFLAELRTARPQITSHLLKLLAFEADEGMRYHWKAELAAFCEDVSGIILKGPKGKRRPPRPEDYIGVLFDAFFESPAEIGNLTRLIARIARDYPDLPRNRLDDEQVRLAMREWYGKATPSMCTTAFDRSIVEAL
jgi:hypothetical protein